MREILDDIERWRATGRRIALARVVATDGSSPRDPGAAMAVSEDGEVAGSVSGGCVEGAVVREALAVLGGLGEPGQNIVANERMLRLVESVDFQIAPSPIQIAL